MTAASTSTKTRSRKAITEITDQLDPAAVAAADALIAEGAASSMAPLDLLPSEAADYAEALELAAPFLAQSIGFQLPVAAGQRTVGHATMADVIQKATACSDRVAVEDASARVSGWVNDAQTVGSTKVFTHRLASITVSAEPDDVDAPRLFLVDVPQGTGFARSLTNADDKDPAKRTPFAIVGLFPSRTYQMTDRRTGELLDRVDLGNLNPSRVWPGHGGIVRMLTQDQADGIDLDWSYDPDTRNLAWALSTLRRLGRIAAARAERAEHQAERFEDDADDLPF